MLKIIKPKRVALSSQSTWCSKFSSYIYFGIFVIFFFIKRAHAATEAVNGQEQKAVSRYPVATFNFDHVSDVYAVTLWILLGSLAKVGKSRSIR